MNLLFVRTAYDSKLLCAIILSCVQCSCLVPQDKSHLLCCGDVFSRSRVSSNPWSGLIRLRQIICNKIFSFPCVLNMDYNPFKSAQSSHPLYLFFYDSKPKFGPHMFNVTPVLWSFHDGLQELIGVALVKVVYLRSMVRKFIYTVQIREFSDQKCQYEISSYWYAQSPYRKWPIQGVVEKLIKARFAVLGISSGKSCSSTLYNINKCFSNLVTCVCIYLWLM